MHTRAETSDPAPPPRPSPVLSGQTDPVAQFVSTPGGQIPTELSRGGTDRQSMNYPLGIDFGGSNVRAAVGDEGFDRRETPAGDASAVCRAIRATIRAAAADAGVEPTAVDRAGVAAAGLLDHEAGTVHPPNLSVERVPIRETVQTAIDGGTVRLLNDATAAALAEWADTTVSNLVYCTISTGIGTGVITADRPLGPNAGELGHIVVDEAARLPCGCGRAGHWEAYCSGENLPQFARLLADGFETTMDLSVLDAETLFDRAGTDPLATAVLDRAAAYNAVGVATAVMAYAPERIVFGGGVVLAHPDRVLDPIRERLPELVPVEPPPLTVTQFGDRIGVRGALVAATHDASD